jgi:hypothetical protein
MNGNSQRFDNRSLLIGDCIRNWDELFGANFNKLRETAIPIDSDHTQLLAYMSVAAKARLTCTAGDERIDDDSGSLFPIIL